MSWPNTQKSPACNSNCNITDSAVEPNTLLLPHFNNNHHNSSPAWAAFTQPRRSLDDLATPGPASTATLFIRPFWLDRPDSFIFHFCCVRLSFTAHHRSIPLLRYYLITFLHSYLFCSSLLRLINYLGGLFCSERVFGIVSLDRHYHGRRLTLHIAKVLLRWACHDGEREWTFLTLLS